VDTDRPKNPGVRVTAPAVVVSNLWSENAANNDRLEYFMGLHDFFEYDDRKAWINQKNHRVSFEEAMTVFTDTLSITITDILHSDEEERRIIIGQSIKRRLLVVVHVECGEKIRIISARRATAHERKQYE
jgi:uncharacterized DUF497 family protein